MLHFICSSINGDLLHFSVRCLLRIDQDLHLGDLASQIKTRPPAPHTLTPRIIVRLRHCHSLSYCTGSGAIVLRSILTKVPNQIEEIPAVLSIVGSLVSLGVLA